MLDGIFYLSDVLKEIENLDGVDEESDYRDELQGFVEACNIAPNTLIIHEYEWGNYVYDVADGMLGGDLESWPVRHIDWEAAADELAMDYTIVEYDGYTYYCES